MNKFAFILSISTIIEANLISTDFISLIRKKYIIIAFKLYFVIFGPRDNNIKVKVLNIKTEYYIALTFIARDYNYIIINVKNFQLFITIEKNFGFISITFIRIKIEYNINCDISFFLINNTKKIFFK